MKKVDYEKTTELTDEEYEKFFEDFVYKYKNNVDVEAIELCSTAHYDFFGKNYKFSSHEEVVHYVRTTLEPVECWSAFNGNNLMIVWAFNVPEAEQDFGERVYLNQYIENVSEDANVEEIVQLAENAPDSNFVMDYVKSDVKVAVTAKIYQAVIEIANGENIEKEYYSLAEAEKFLMLFTDALLEDKGFVDINGDFFNTKYVVSGRVWTYNKRMEC